MMELSLVSGLLGSRGGGGACIQTDQTDKANDKPRPF